MVLVYQFQAMLDHIKIYYFYKSEQLVQGMIRFKSTQKSKNRDSKNIFMFVFSFGINDFKVLVVEVEVNRHEILLALNQ